MMSLIAAANTGILTDLLNSLLGVLQAGPEALKGRAGNILALLISIELAWAGISIALSGGDGMWKHMLTKFIKCGIWALLVMEYPLIVEELRDFFLDAGSAAGGGSTGVATLLDPSAIADMGFTATLPIWEMLEAQEDPIFSGFSVSAFGSALVILPCGLAILILYYLIAIAMFLATVEFYVVAAVGVILVPWGVNDNTKFIAERFMGAMVAMGVKLMVISFLCTATLPVLKSFKLPPDPTFTQVFTLLLGVMTVALLNWRAPNVAASLMSGSASLTASDSIGVASQAGGAVAQAAGAVASGGTSAAVQGTKAATSAISAASSLHGSESSSRQGAGGSSGAMQAASSVAQASPASSASMRAGSDMSQGGAAAGMATGMEGAQGGAQGGAQASSATSATSAPSSGGTVSPSATSGASSRAEGLSASAVGLSGATSTGPNAGLAEVAGGAGAAATEAQGSKPVMRLPASTQQGVAIHREASPATSVGPVPSSSKEDDHG